MANRVETPQQHKPGDGEMGKNNTFGRGETKTTNNPGYRDCIPNWGDKDVPQKRLNRQMTRQVNPRDDGAS